MNNLFNPPNTAADFVYFMEQAWDADGSPNAVETIKRTKAKDAGPTVLSGEAAHTWVFPDGTKVFIADHGGAVSAGRHKQ